MNYSNWYNRAFLLCAAILLTTSSIGQTVINEFSAANQSHFPVEDDPWNEQFEDWVEFLNTSDEDHDLSGYWLSDDLEDPEKWAFPSGTILAAGEHLIVLLSGIGDYDPDAYGYLNADFKIRQTGGEQIVLSDPMGNVVEYHDYSVWSANQADHSYCRYPDGTENWIICTEPSPGEINSSIGGSAYAAKPIADIQAGFYASEVTVTLTTSEPNSTIYYTLDGSPPTNLSLPYSAPISITDSSPLRAITYSDEATILPSFIETNTYLINEPDHSLPVACLAGFNLDEGLWQEAKPSVIEYFSPQGELITKGHGETNEHGADANAYDQRGFDYINQDQFGHDHHLDHPFFHNTSRTEFQRLIFKPAGSDNYPFGNGQHMRDDYVQQIAITSDMDLDCRSSNACIVYLNGSYWGVYSMREKVDDIDYLKHYYGQGEGDVDYIKTWGGTWAEYGVMDDWQDVIGDIPNLDPCNGVGFEEIGGDIDMQSWIDFYILNSFFVNQAWLNWDISWWKGNDPDGEGQKWRFAIWDMDQYYDAINFSGIPDTSPEALPCDFLEFSDLGGQGHIPLISALFEDPEFEEVFVYRYVELVNSGLSCEHLNFRLDSLEQVMQPEMQRHTETWGGSLEEWQESVDGLRDFINARCEAILPLIEQCWDVDSNEGYDLIVSIDGEGSVNVNGEVFNQDESPFIIEDYNCDAPISLEAIDNLNDFEFVNWTISAGGISIDSTEDPLLQIDLTEDLEASAYFDLFDGVNTPNYETLRIFPNPADDHVQITAAHQIESITIIDNQGRIVLDLTEVHDKLASVTTDHLPNGFYSIQVKTAGNVESSSLLISH